MHPKKQITCLKSGANLNILFHNAMSISQKFYFQLYFFDFHQVYTNSLQ